MTITVFHLRHLDQLTQMALSARLARGDVSPEVTMMGLREKVRHPSLNWSVERLEEVAKNPLLRRQYFRLLRNQHIAFAAALYALDGYVAVAEVEGDLELAYKLTNSYEDPWKEANDARVRPTPEARNESSDVGDLFRDNATGVIYLCARDGFEVLGNLDLPKAA